MAVTIHTKNVLVACSSFFLLCFSAYVVMPLIPLYLEDQCSMVEIAWITVGASILGVIPASIIGGRVVDYIGPKISIAVALLIFGFSKFLFPYTQTFFLLFFLRAIGGLYAMAFPAVQSVLISEAETQEKRTTYLGYYGFAFGLGLAFGPIVGGFIGQQSGLEGAFDATLYLSLIGVLIICFLNVPRRAVKKQKLLILSKEPLFWVAAISAFLCMGTMGTLLSQIPIIAKNSLYLSKQQIGLCMALLTGCFAVWQLLVGQVFRPKQVLATITYGFFVAAAGLLFFFFTDSSLFCLLTGLAMTGIGLGTVYIGATSVAASTTTPENRGGVMGLFTAAMNLGYGLLTIFVISFANLVEQRFSFLFLASMLLLAGMAISRMSRGGFYD